MAARYLDDFQIGEQFDTKPVVLGERDIIAFAELYDPQTIHTDPAAAANEGFGGLIASGFQTIAIGFGQFIRLGMFDGVSLGGPAMDEARWLTPVHPGDTLHTARSPPVVFEAGPRCAGAGISNVEPAKEERVLFQDGQYHSPTRARVAWGVYVPRGQSQAKGRRGAG